MGKQLRPIIASTWNPNTDPQAPIAIGGLGGSGTRLVAQLLLDLGFYMGNDLNAANDNLWFTLLFKRARWFYSRASNNHAIVSEGLDIFTKAMMGTFSLQARNFVYLARAVGEIAWYGHDAVRSGKGTWPFARIRRMLRARQHDFSRYTGWGWKEPNSHVYLKNLYEYFPRIRYIHVIRHGLDMAFNRNQAQTSIWGRLFGVPVPALGEPSPKATLQYWIRANQKAIAFGDQMGPDQFIVVNFNELCSSPPTEIERLVLFLGLDAKEARVKKLYAKPKTPKSSGIHKKRDLSIFTTEEIEAVRQLGFAVDV